MLVNIQEAPWRRQVESESKSDPLRASVQPQPQGRARQGRQCAQECVHGVITEEIDAWHQPSV